MNLCLKSSEYLQLVKNSNDDNDNILDIETYISDVSVEEIYELEDDEKKCFWCNLYNGLARKEMKFYSNYSSSIGEKIRFFYYTNLDVAGHSVSLQKMEHSILRKGRPSFGLGYIRLPQLSIFKRHVQPNEFDNRIHFLLNCGAKSCPRVKPLTSDNYESESENLTQAYIQREVSVGENTITVPRIFLWYLGDFNSKSGIKDLIGQYSDEDIQDKNVEFDNYNWNRTEKFFE